MTKEFYDGKVRPLITPRLSWTIEELERICLNCGKTFGKHCEYECREY